MAVEQSILKSTKANLGIGVDDTSFDTEVLTFINGALSDLVDFGIGPDSGFEVTGNDEEWVALTGDNLDLNRLRTWLYLKVRMVFDPPQTSFLQDAFQKQIDEASWRMINHQDRERRRLSALTDVDDDEPIILDGGGA